MRIPKPIARLIESFEKLPGIGPKTAQRLTFYLLHFPKEELERFANALTDLKVSTELCRICKNVDESNPCVICSDSGRDTKTIIVASNPLDVFAFEKTGYDGLYHVLHGVINPLENIGPEELFIHEIVGRLRELVGEEQVEVILATNAGMEGESTAMYIAKLIRDNDFSEDQVRITRIARGLPVGGDVEYADDITLSRALEGRLEY